MGSSVVNIGFFVVTTIVYYLKIKPTLSLDIINDPGQFKQYTSDGSTSLAIFLLLVIMSQFLLNVSDITTTCGGNISDNIGAAGLLTFFPWFLIFGALIMVLALYPGFKSAFSDVIGYFYVAGSANTLLAELLVDKDVQDKLNADSTSTPEQKNAMQDAAEVIIKICGNSSILINQIVPLNFEDYWKILNPLMKTPFQNSESAETQSMKKKLFELVVVRDNIGEAMWFIYTGFLITSLVQLNISNRGCKSSPAAMEKNYQEFLDQQDAEQQDRDQSTKQVYTVT
jgi:hypothetical protein